MTLRHARRLALATLCAVPALAQAGIIEDMWRGFLDRNPQLAAAVRPYGREVATPTVTKRVDQLPLGKNQWAVFVVPGCASCDAAVAHLRSTGVTLEVFDITRSKTGREAFSATGATGYPAVVIGRYLVTGWSQAAFERAVINEGLDNDRERQGSGW
jgi:glutaredoxin